MPRLPDDIPDIWHAQWLARQGPEVQKQYAESDALAAELAGERPAFVGLSDAPMFPNQRFDAPPASAAPLSVGEEVDPVERARLNVVDSFYRGTLAGATVLRKLAALAEASNEPQPDDVTRAEQGLFGSALPSRDQLKAEYRKAVADLQKFDRIRPSTSWLDFGATISGQIVGGIPTPESALGAPLRGATLLGRAVKAGAWTAGVNAATDPIVQNLSIGSKVQEKYDWARTAAAAPIGFVIGAGGGAIASAGSKGSVAGVVGTAPVSRTTGLGRDVEFDQFIAGQRGVTFEQLYDRARGLQNEIEKIGDEVKAQTGAQFVSSGVKGFNRAFEKIARKGYEGPYQLTDIARSAFVVRTPDQADALVAHLAKRFRIFDEGYRFSDTGYFDRKVLVGSADGTVGEIQIVPEGMYRAKQEHAGHTLYEQSRSLPEGTEKTTLEKQQSELYSNARRELSPEWAAVLSK